MEKRFLDNNFKVRREGTKINMSVDIADISYGNLKDIKENENGNRTVLYQKFTEGGITFQVTAYVRKNDFLAIKNAEETAALKQAIAERDAVLNQLFTAAKNPEFQKFLQQFGVKLDV